MGGPSQAAGHVGSTPRGEKDDWSNLRDVDPTPTLYHIGDRTRGGCSPEEIKACHDLPAHVIAALLSWVDLSRAQKVKPMAAETQNPFYFTLTE